MRMGTDAPVKETVTIPLTVPGNPYLPKFIPQEPVEPVKVPEREKELVPA